MIAIPGQPAGAAPASENEDMPVLSPRTHSPQQSSGAIPTQPQVHAQTPAPVPAPAPFQPTANPNLTPIYPTAAQPAPYAQQPGVPVIPTAQPQAGWQGQPQAAYPGYGPVGHVMTSADIMLMVAGILGLIQGGVTAIFHFIRLIQMVQLLARTSRFSTSLTLHNVVHLLLSLGLLVLAGIPIACAIGLLVKKKWGMSIGGPIAISYIAVVAVQTIYVLAVYSRYVRFASDAIVWWIVRCVLLIGVPIFWIVVYSLRLNHSKG